MRPDLHETAEIVDGRENIRRNPIGASSRSEGVLKRFQNTVASPGRLGSSDAAIALIESCFNGTMRAPSPELPKTASTDHRLDLGDLRDVNRVVEAAIASWHVSDRVRRLALPSLLYRENDLRHMRFALVDDSEGAPIAVAAWEEILGEHVVQTGANVQLHGLYVRPEWQRQGVGSSLLEFVGLWVGMHDIDGITVRSWRDSEGFFRSQGFEPLPDDKPIEIDSALLWRSSQWMH